MIETIDYSVQFLLLIICSGLAGIRFTRSRSRGWLILAFFFTCYALGDLYWLLCVALTGATPKLHLISELSWYAGYLFLILLVREMQEGREPPKNRWAWAAPVFAVASCLYFLRLEDYLGNIITTVLMGRLGYLAVQGLLGEREPGPVRRMYLLVVLFFLVEYAMWFASCFWISDSLANPYFWFDGLLTLILVLMPRTYRRVVTA